MLRRPLAIGLSAVVLNVAVCWTIALMAPVPSVERDGALTSEQVETHLAFVFGDDLRWSDAAPLAGHASHGAFVRRAYVSGRTEAPEATPYAERVLKVGWPFTT
ncbi:MAG: hypothetical protein AAFQ43_09655, partial [Bacteroidota bacterium]